MSLTVVPLWRPTGSHHVSYSVVLQWWCCESYSSSCSVTGANRAGSRWRWPRSRGVCSLSNTLCHTQRACVMCLQASPLLSCRQQSTHGCLGRGFPFITERTHSWALHTSKMQVQKYTRRLVNSFLSLATTSYSPAHESDVCQLLQDTHAEKHRHTHTVLCSALSKQLE